ncbi:MAG: endoglucanase [Methyloprofundus sp.]|nr:MAG: endoglucanase [Methyloprofundus sp.]
MLKVAFLCLCCLFHSAFAADVMLEQKAWGDFKQQFVSSDGRVIDSTNKGISHSEGQGYGLLFAVYFNDRETFAKIWHWSKANLQTRDDHLLSWKYIAGQGVADVNNASDGDVLVAWALLRAARKWQSTCYLQESQAILSDIRNKLIQSWQGYKVILPAEHGFMTKSDNITINLSYWVFPAFLEFMTVDTDSVWSELIVSGLFLSNNAQYGQWRLPADWLLLSDVAIVSPEKPPLFGYEAIRIPLYLGWAKLMSPDIIRRFVHYVQASQHRVGYLSPTVNLSNNHLAEYSASTGFIAVYQQLAQVRVKLPQKEDDDYYSRSLSLLAYIAQQQSAH